MSIPDRDSDRPTHSAAPAEDLPDFPVPSHDPRAVSDAIRPGSGVALSSSGAMVLLRHADVVAAAENTDVFSSAVSRFLQVPNGLDGEDHAASRRLIDPYFSAERMASLEPTVREVARDLCAELAATAWDGAVRCDAVGEVGSRFAVRAMTAWLGWPADLEPALLQWMVDNQAATRSGRLEATAEVARRYDEIIESVLAPRRAAAVRDVGAREPADVTEELMRDETLGRALHDDELVSILRNWTGGDLGSLALCLGVVLHHLATHRDVQDHVRSGPSRGELAAIVDEILRIDDPFVANRRVTACPVSHGGVHLPEGQRVVLNWTSANRDEQVFVDPDRFDPKANSENNLVWGTGPHVCPGRPLATLELCVAVKEIVTAFADIALDPDAEPERSATPTGGYASVPVVLTVAR